MLYYTILTLYLILSKSVQTLNMTESKHRERNERETVAAFVWLS